MTTDIGLQWARPAVLVAGKGRGGMFLFLLFLHFHSCSSFFPVPLFHLFYHLFYLFSPFLWETTQNDPQGWGVVEPQHNQKSCYPEQCLDDAFFIQKYFTDIFSGFLTLSTLGKIFSRRHFEIFFLFFPENRIWHCMQIVSSGDNLHEMSDPVFWEK